MQQNNTTLLIVDVQKGFIKDHTSHIPERVSDLQWRYNIVAVTQFYNADGSFFEKLLDWHALKKGTDDFDLAFCPKQDAYKILKSTYTAITDNYLNFLQDHKVETVDICGIDTQGCVLKCALDLFDAGIRPVILKNYCASTSGNKYHEQALATLRHLIGENPIQ